MAIERYDWLSRLFHWFIAIGIIGLIWLGWVMVDLTYYDPWYHDTLSLHKAFGMLILLLALLKFGWRWYRPAPPLLPGLSALEIAGARTVHFLLGFLMIVVPVTGYLISTSAEDPVSIFGLFEIPAVVPKNDNIRDAAIAAHYYFAYGGAFLIVLHVAAALKHQFIDKNNILRRMI